MTAHHLLPLLAIVVTGLAGCDDDNVSCDCVMSGLQISAGSAQVESVTASGPACATPQIRCGGPDSTYRAGCDYYYLVPSAQGDCDVVVTTVGGDKHSKKFKFTYSGGECCSGYYTSDSTWNI